MRPYPMQTLLNDSNLLGFGGVPQALKNLCCGLLKETPTAHLPLMISFKGLNCYKCVNYFQMLEMSESKK